MILQDVGFKGLGIKILLLTLPAFVPAIKGAEPPHMQDLVVHPEPEVS
jgi:hypothetical protein